jgi:AbrB family looped-hinge helix DNA binding protein
MSENNKKSEFNKKSELIIETIKIGRRGQVTIPKNVRTAEALRIGDRLKIVRQPTGTIYLTKIPKEKNPFDRLMTVLEKVPKFDAEKAWKEVERERRESER